MKNLTFEMIAKEVILQAMDKLPLRCDNIIIKFSLNIDVLRMSLDDLSKKYIIPELINTNNIFDGKLTLENSITYKNISCSANQDKEKINVTLIFN